MSLVLEITCTKIKIGIVGQEPDIIPINYYQNGIYFPPQFELNDHAITQSQRNEIINNLLPENKEIIYDYNKINWLPLRESKVSKQLLQKLIHQVLYENSYFPRTVLVIDHDFSNILKLNIEEILKGLQAKTVNFIPSSVLTVLGSNKRDGLVIYYSIECVKIYSIIDLRQISVVEDLRVNELNHNNTVIQELINKVIDSSPIDIRKSLKDNIIIIGDNIAPKYSLDCWTSASIYGLHLNQNL